MFDERGCDVQHDRYVVAREYWRAEPLSASTCRRRTLRRPGHVPALHRLRAPRRHDPASWRGARRQARPSAPRTRRREVELDRCPPSHPVVLEQHDTTREGGRCSQPMPPTISRPSTRKASVLLHRQLDPVPRTYPRTRIKVAHRRGVARDGSRNPLVLSGAVGGWSRASSQPTPHDCSSRSKRRMEATPFASAQVRSSMRSESTSSSGSKSALGVTLEIDG